MSRKVNFIQNRTKIAGTLHVDLLFTTTLFPRFTRLPSIVIDNKYHREYSIVIDINLPYFLL
jgi:hypothetical protein